MDGARAFRWVSDVCFSLVSVGASEENDRSLCCQAPANSDIAGVGVGRSGDAVGSGRRSRAAWLAHFGDVVF